MRSLLRVIYRFKYFQVCDEKDLIMAIDKQLKVRLLSTVLFK